MADLIAILQKTISNNHDDQVLAMDYLKRAAETNYPAFILELSTVLKNTGNTDFVRQAAGLQLKNVLEAKDAVRKQLYTVRWLQLENNTRIEVRNNVLQTIGTEPFRPSAASICIAAIAGIEIPNKLWENGIESLCESVTSGTNGAAKEVALEAIGYICSDLEVAVLESKSNVILTAIAYGMRGEETNLNIKRAAVKAMLSSLDFTGNNFNSELERNHIMQLVCDASQFTDTTVKVTALECLVKIMSLYYNFMQPYMGQALFPISVSAMNSGVPEVVLQGIEFWSNVAENELAIQQDIEEARENGTEPTQFTNFYAKGALQYITPIVVQLLVKEDETDDDDDWTPSKAAGVCLQLLAQCTGDDIVEFILPFITTNFSHADWRLREAAVMAFGCIMDGPDIKKLNELVNQALGSLIQTLGDSNILVRDTAAWTLGKVCELCIDVVTKPEVLQQLLPALSQSLHQEPRVAANICWTISALAKAAYEIVTRDDSLSEPQTFVLSNCYESIINELLKTTDREDASTANLRIAAYETLMELIKNSPKDCYTIVQKTTLTVLQKMEDLLSYESTMETVTDKSQLRNLQSLLCATLQSVLKKIKREDTPLISDLIMKSILQIMQRCTGKESGGVMEDALLTVSALIESLGRNFAKYLEVFKPFLISALRNVSESVICVAGLGVLTDLCREFERDICPILDEVMHILIEILHSSAVDIYLKPDVLTCFGDIALAIGESFERYFAMSMSLIMEATKNAKITNYGDYEHVDYIDHLRENIVTALVGIIQACPNGKNLAPYMEQIVQGIIDIASEETCPESLLSHTCGLLGDIIKIFGPEILRLVNSPVIEDLLNRGRRCAKSKNTALFATKEYRKIKPGM
uniref:Importin N-terminal domain-containing protein n=1 Tax=Rhabditophanes sp. KR3021 TaxID=114890 RepID=A0AC35UBM6_9BILA